MRRRTFEERLTQLGNIANIEGTRMRARGQRGIMPRTALAKAILKRCEYNVFGRLLDTSGMSARDRYIAEHERHTNAEWQGQTTNH